MIVKVKYESRGRHTFGRIFMGPDPDGLTLCGPLMFKASEFQAYRKLLEDGALLSNGIKVIFEDVTDGSGSRNPKIRLPPD